ncbi:MAG: 2-C-methyl-D-erythritol 2,4-cyclodiphosphate synthase [Candidatus Bipolaricaulota bacterium]|nr:2-C-methyl-D-erythritol 2,4-cyclodiphosphate synthase [Candidatus Bipolaricaulota bacterium]
MTEVRTGLGIDFHRFVAGRPLVLGGETIPYEKGLLGHSDADVLTHAICDAVLGAAGLGDIGVHFPDTDPAYRGISSLKLLADVRVKLATAGYRVVNVDATVIAERPKLTPHFRAMKHRLADALGIESSYVSLKATTNEGMGAVGRGEGMAAWAVALIETAAGYPDT